MVRPNFFLIGAARSGTTALARALGARDEIFITEPKEPHFLALHGTEPAFSGPERLLVLDYADLAADIDAVVARIDRFLDLGPRPSRQRAQEPANISGEHRSRSGAALSGALERRPGLRRTVRRIVPPRARDALRRCLLRPSAMPSSARTRLIEATADDTTHLRRLLGDAAPSFTRRA